MIGFGENERAQAQACVPRADCHCRVRWVSGSITGASGRLVRQILATRIELSRRAHPHMMCAQHCWREFRRRVVTVSGAKPCWFPCSATQQHSFTFISARAACSCRFASCCAFSTHVLAAALCCSASASCCASSWCALRMRLDRRHVAALHI